MTPHDPARTLARLQLMGSLLATLAACSRPRTDDLGGRDASSEASADARSDSGPETSVDAAADASADVVQCGPDAGAIPQVCNGRCVDLASDRMFCGRCDRPCAPDEVCQGGSCLFTCAAGLVSCRNRCIDPRTDPDYCGAQDNCRGSNAGTQCVGGQSCVSGTCRFECPAGQIACDGNCIDPSIDPRFCGASGACTGATRGAACPTGRVCELGGCKCPRSYVSCDGACIDPNTNRAFCGASGDCTGTSRGVACPAGQICIGGTCGSTCGTGAVLCGGNCVDPSTNRAYCGARGDCAGANAGTTCTATELCLNGECRYFEPPRSYASVAIEEPFSAIVPSLRPIDVSIGGPRPATIFYTCDGSTPSPGAVTTQTASNARVVEVGTTICPQIRWFADYGAPLGRERVVHARTVQVSAPNPNTTSLGMIVDAVRINSRGPVALLRPGEPFELTFNHQWWSSSPSGYCPGCVVQASVSMDSDNAAGFVSIACENYAYGNFYPGRSSPRRIMLTAPNRPGRYAIRAQTTLNFSCLRGGAYPGGPPVAFVIVN
jgi:hypothetical protein